MGGKGRNFEVPYKGRGKAWEKGFHECMQHGIFVPDFSWKRKQIPRNDESKERTR